MDRIYPVTLTAPPGTLPTGPITQPVTLENASLISIELLIPPGHCGFTGLRVRSSRQQVLPWGNIDWIIADNYTNTFPVNEEIGSRAISIQAYNTDVYDHTFYIRLLIRDLISPGTGGLSGAMTPVIGQMQGGQGSTSPLESIGGGIVVTPLPPSLTLPPPPPPPIPPSP